MTLPTEILAEIKSQVMVAGVLAEIALPSGTQRVWSGAFPLEPADGRRWTGVHLFGAVSSLESATALEAPSFTLELKSPGEGLTPDQEAAFIAGMHDAFAQSEDALGGAVTIALQVFDVATNAQIGSPVAVTSAVIGHIESDWLDVTSARAVAQCEHLLAFAWSPAHAYLTDADQQARHPGDEVCAFVPILAERQFPWP